MAWDPSNNPNRFDSIAGIFKNGVKTVIWWHETKTGECKIEWDLGSGKHVKEFKNYDKAQKFYTKILKQIS